MALEARAAAAMALVLWAAPVFAAAVPVRFTEGVTRGFLTVRSEDGKQIGEGDLIQVAHGNRVENKMILRFRDGSLYDERLEFTQDRVFALLRYHLVQRGPSFTEPLDADFDVREGRYSVTSGAGKDKKVAAGHLDFPPDVYNGLTTTLLRNLPPGAAHTVHMATFTPEPQLVEVEMTPAGKRPVEVASVKRSAERYLVKAKLGPVKGLLAKVLGKEPRDTECLIIAGDVPALVRCDTALAPDGPLWRIEVASPSGHGRSG